MKFLKLLLKNLTRNWLRTLLTVGSIAASLFLVTTLLTVLHHLTTPPETPESALRLIVRHRISLFNALPHAHRDKIATVDGVDAVIGSMWFGGVYDDKGAEVQLAQFAVDADQFFYINSDMELPEEQKQAFLEDRGGAVVGESLAERFGWKIGDRIHTKSNLFPTSAELNVRGIYKGGADQGGGVYFHWTYFDEAVKGVMGGFSFAGTFSIRARSADEIPRIADEVDALFKNTTYPTKTETEKAFILGFVSMLGNVQLLIGSICSAVIFAVVLVAANTMAMSFRERAREVGILKALGFKRSQVLSLMMGESLLVALGGTIIGSLLAKFLFEIVDLGKIPAAGTYLQGFAVADSTLLLCSAVGVLVGLLAAGFPAWRTAQRPVVEALRKVV